MRRRNNPILTLLIVLFCLVLLALALQRTCHRNFSCILWYLLYISFFSESFYQFFCFFCLSKDSVYIGKRDRSHLYLSFPPVVQIFLHTHHDFFHNACSVFFPRCISPMRQPSSHSQEIRLCDDDDALEKCSEEDKAHYGKNHNAGMEKYLNYRGKGRYRWERSRFPICIRRSLEKQKKQKN